MIAWNEGLANPLVKMSTSCPFVETYGMHISQSGFSFMSADPLPYVWSDHVELGYEHVDSRLVVTIEFH